MPGLFFILGLFVGSFLNVLADRLPNGEDVIRGRSHCDFCRKPLRWWELVPVFSFAVLGGKCARCRHRLSWQYPLSELATAAGYAYLTYRLSGSPALLGVSLVAYSTVLVILISDLKYMIIPDSMLVIGGLTVLGYRLASAPFSAFLLTYLLPATAASVFFLLLWIVTRGRGMGFGDVKLIFYLSLLTGFPGVVILLYTAFLTGAFTGVILIVSGGKTLKSKVAFGPFLIFGTVVTLLYHTAILSWWKGVI